MRTPKKIWKSIAKKFKNSAAAKEQEPSVSSSTEKRRRQKILEDIPRLCGQNFREAIQELQQN